MNSDWVIKIVLSAAVTALSIYLCLKDAKLLRTWFLSAWEMNAALYYIVTVPKIFIVTQLYVFTIHNYFDNERNGLFVSFVFAGICAIACLAMLIFNSAVGAFYFVGLLHICLAAAPFIGHMVFGRVKGTNGRPYAIFNRYAPMTKETKVLIRRQKYQTEFTSMLGFCQRYTSIQKFEIGEREIEKEKEREKQRHDDTRRI